jgi:two-component system response regulator FixJ
VSERIVHLVDDDEAIRRSAGFMLKTSGYQVKAYPSGVDLLKESKDIAPGCILLDVRMPEMDGLRETVREGRASKRY